MRALGFILIVAGIAAGAGLGAWLAARALGAETALSWLAAVGIGWVILVGTDAVLALIGGWTYSRFDVARDRG